ncbi:MAG: hypothetical protein M0P61_18180 [Ignavibacteriaceae bacterium]|jgi:deoxycytidine triphosphate deaminase|nr:hypothetical protein [Ignavibacteriaceae bacterium]
MILSGKSIQKLLDDGVIKIEPEPSLKEASIKIHLSSKFSEIGRDFEDLKEFTLKPKEFILALSKEQITLSDKYAGLYDGYTYLAQKGLTSHMGSMFIDPGSNLQITLEIYNASNNDIILREGDRIGQLVIVEVN